MWIEDEAIECIREMDYDFMIIDNQYRIILAKRKQDGKIILDDCFYDGYETLEEVFYVPQYPNVIVQVVVSSLEGKPCLHDEKGRVYSIDNFMSGKPSRRVKKHKKKK